ncbi:MAG: ATP-binding cassette domain-containing protein [Vicinamibacteria bacterium]
MSEAPALSLTGLAKRYANGRGIQDVALQIPRRSIYCLLGPNGAGKSTTLGVLAGWFSADAGTMAIGGVNVDVRRPGHRVGLGFVPDVPILDEALNGWEWASYVTAIKARAWPHELATQIASPLSPSFTPPVVPIDRRTQPFEQQARVCGRSFGRDGCRGDGGKRHRRGLRQLPLPKPGPSGSQES